MFVLVLFPEEPVAKLLDWLVAEDVGFLDLLIFRPEYRSQDTVINFGQSRKTTSVIPNNLRSIFG